MTSWRSLTKSNRGFNRQSVQGAIRALQTALKRYKAIPTNGIALFSGIQPIAGAFSASEGESSISSATASSASSALSNERERLMVREIEPLKPLRTGMYRCDGRFHSESLLEQMSDRIAFGFVLVDGSGCHMYEVSGDTYELVWKHGDPDLPNKHGRGGQSAPRFGRLRAAARAAWVSTVATQLNTAFTDKSTGNISVAGIIMCGSGDLKQQVAQRDNVLDERVRAAILPTLVDIQYGGHAGIQEAIKKAAPLMHEQSFSLQRSILTTFMNGIANETGLIAYGATDVMHAMEAGAVSSLLLSETLAYRRVTYRNVHSQESCIDFVPGETGPLPSAPAHIRSMMRSSDDATLGDFAYDLSSSSSAPGSNITGGESGTEWRTEAVEPLLDFLVSAVTQLGLTVNLISPASTTGAQFSAAFGGIGAILRWTLPLPSDEMPLDDSEEDEYDFDF